MIRLSALQFPTLRHFVEGKPYLTIEEAQKLDQRPFRSMLVRGYVSYAPGKGFHITADGMTAWDDFRYHDFMRKDLTLPLTRYFDPVAYGLAPAKPPVHVMRRRRVA